MVQWIAADRIVTIDEIGRGSRSTVVRCGCAVTRLKEIVDALPLCSLGLPLT
jgi:hypothetical protein